MKKDLWLEFIINYMYYYIMEQPKSGSIAKAQENIRKILANLGIVGEIVSVSPARTTGELVEMGINKSYSTIIAVGSDPHINRIATYLKNTNCAFGIIPINCSQLIHQLIGTGDLKEACEILKYRKLRELSMGAIEPNKFYITQVEIPSNSSEKVSITIINPGSDSYTAETTMSEIIISRNLYLFVTDKLKDYNLVKNTWNWLTGKKEKDIISSVLRGKKIKIETENPIPVYLNGEIIAKTPIVATFYQKALKIITKPARIVLEENERNNEKTKYQ